MKKDYMIGILGAIMILMLVPNVLADTGMSISVSKYEPYPAAPGQTVKVWLLVQNTGDTDLKNINVEAISRSPFSPYNQDSIKTIDILGAHKDYLIDFNLKVDDNVVEGYNNFRIKYGYGGGTIQEKDVEIYVQTRDATLTIEEVSVEPSEISPGTDGILTISVKNNAPSTMTDLSMKLQLQAIVGSTLVDLPFAPIDSGTERRIYMLEPGKSTEFQYKLRIYPDATSRVYKIPFTLTYYDSLGNAKNKSDYVGIVVNGVPDISIIVENTDLTMQNRNGMVELKVINKGVSDIKFLNVIVKETGDFEMLSNSDTTYLGNLISDDYQTAEYRINLKSKENTIQIPVTLQYRDSNNRYYEEKINVELNLIDSNKIKSGSKGGFGWIFFIVILLAVGGIWYYRRTHKKNKKGQFYQ